MYASLIRNGQFIVSVWDNAAVDTNDSATNSVVLQMEPEESVHVELFSGRVITDDIHHYSTFTGFLMSPL
ncbi:C1QL2 protein, partial [Atractosteus spatula]|nr:C1QL2 protein [Atractosteus spatula]